MADTAYACPADALSLAETLVIAAGHAEDAETVIARQTRYGGGSRGGSSEPLPVDLTAAARYDAIENAIGTWTRHVLEAQEIDLPAWQAYAGPPCAAGWCEHDSCREVRGGRPTSDVAVAAAWLATQTGWLRKRPEAGEAFAELEHACRDLARLVDRPADQELVGMCDCGKVLYAPRGKVAVTCPVPTCKLRWNVAESREILRKALRGRLFTASECARLGAYWTDRTQPQIRALITTWTRPDRQRITARGWIPNEDYVGDGEEPEGWSTYLLGDVLDLLAQTPRRQRNREGVAA
jgi:hypothetical protein